MIRKLISILIIIIILLSGCIDNDDKDKNGSENDLESRD